MFLGLKDGIIPFFGIYFFRQFKSTITSTIYCLCVYTGTSDIFCVVLFLTKTNVEAGMFYLSFASKAKTLRNILGYPKKAGSL